MEERAKRKLFFLAAASAVIAAFLLAGVPRLYSLVHFSSYLNLRTGNVLTVCRIPGMTLCRRETPSVLSPRLSGYVLHPHPEWLHIREKHGFGRLYLKKAAALRNCIFSFWRRRKRAERLPVRNCLPSCRSTVSERRSSPNGKRPFQSSMMEFFSRWT